jgi:hypothetical protein
MTTAARNKSLTALLWLVPRSLFFFAICTSAADLRISQTQPKDHHVVLNFPVDRAKAEALQGWVNEGHDSWCTDAQLVAASALSHISTRFSEFEPASLELESSQKTKVIYTFHSLDSRTTYRITVRRFRFLLPTAGSLERIVWLPETAEITSRDVQD